MPDGAAYYERVQRLLADLDDAETSLSGATAVPGYLRQAGTPAHPRELGGTHHRIVGFTWARSGKTYPYTMRRNGETLHVQGRYALAVDDGNAHLAAGLAGLGVLWLPHYMCKPQLAQGELVPLHHQGPQRPDDGGHGLHIARNVIGWHIPVACCVGGAQRVRKLPLGLDAGRDAQLVRQQPSSSPPRSM